MATRTTAGLNTNSFQFSTKEGASEFLAYANSLTEVARAMHPVHWNSKVEYTRVIVSGTSSLLFDLSLSDKLTKKHSFILMKERIQRLHARAVDCKGKDDALAEMLERKAKELEEELKTASVA